MKKLLVVLLVALLAVALVACGGNDETTEKPKTTTEPAVTTTVPAEGGDETTPAEGGDETTPAEGGDETTPDTTPDTTEPFEGYDLINEILCIDAWTSDPLCFATFEDSHGDLDFNVAVVFKMNNYDSIYQDLFYTEVNEDGTFNTNVWEANDTYKWVFTVDGKEFECDGFSLFNNGDSGWIRASLGSTFKFDDYEYDDNNQHEYAVSLKIYDDTNEVMYFADFTEFGALLHTKPVKPEMIVDADRPTDVERVPFSQVTAISGPNAGGGEGFEKMFDNDVRSKLCTGANGEEGAIVLSFTSAQSIMGISLVNANDNAAYNARTVVAFDIYVSEDGQTWGDPVVSFSGLDADGNAIDKSTISGNYAENFFDFGKVVTDVTNVKIVVNNGETYQISELIFWQG